MKVTTRDLFNYVNPACKYLTFLKKECLEDGDYDGELFNAVRDAKMHGTLAGEQVHHNRSDDEVDCG